MTYEWKIIYEKGREWKKKINHELLKIINEKGREWKKEINHELLKIINEKEGDWKKEINHKLLIPQFNYAMIKRENLINQFKENSMKIGRECKIFDMNYISSVFF